ncbi:hypothetical protein TrRE_jg12813 [Triparma retinervis]|uniref:PDZ domain-containing protein n=1 Tax=Triparma retinervis TaxID=2557542 RepID=A0A9W6ZUM3_9STRA|nr:hypothetical protein TrRE_jg12813 [Triparma retinervis]
MRTLVPIFLLQSLLILPTYALRFPLKIPWTPLSATSPKITAKFPSKIDAYATRTVTICTLCLTLLSQNPSNANAKSYTYGSFTREQAAVAEAWRIVDNVYYDRTFNGGDWYKARTSSLDAVNPDNYEQVTTKMLQGLGDKYTVYLSPDKYKSMVTTVTGDITGVGVTLSNTPTGAVKIVGVESTGAAGGAGVKVGDIIKEVNGKKDLDADGFANLCRGEVGGRVVMTVEREGDGKEFILERKKFTPQTVKREGDVVRVSSWDGNTVEKVVKEVGNSKRITLDLTSNPGGLMTAGVDLANEFLEAGDGIVRVVDKTGIVRQEKGLGNGRLRDVDLSIIVDENTASASEVFTGAMKDNKRAGVYGLNKC